MEEIKKLSEKGTQNEILNQKLEREILMLKEITSGKEEESKELVEQLKNNSRQMQGKLK